MLRRRLLRRPPQISDPNCAFVLTGTGFAILLQHSILAFLYTVDCHLNRDIASFGQCSAVLFCITVTWRQVDTPSVADEDDDD